MAKPLEYNATLIERVDLTSALTIFKIRPDDGYQGDGPWFVPGQYVTLGMNNEAQPDLGSVRRAMSIVSAPEETEQMEFYIRYVNYPESDNPLTHLMWKGKAGDRLYLRNRPTGRFTVAHAIGDDDPRLKLCVAAGTGLAPFVSMVRSRQLREPGSDLSDFAILHGASYPADLGYADELDGYKKFGLKYFKTVSRPDEAPDWDGDKGRVEAYFEGDRLGELEERLGLGAGGLTPASTAILICGLTGTISKTLMALLHRGFVPEPRRLRRVLEVPEDAKASLFFEQYDNTPVVPVDNEEVMSDLKAQLRAALGG